MGAYVSIDDCKAHYNKIVNCTVKIDTTNFNAPNQSIGGFDKGTVPADADVAGIGVCIYI